MNSEGKCTTCTTLTNSKTCILAGIAVTCSAGSFPSKGVCVSCVMAKSACSSACLKLGFFSLKSTTTNVTSCNACGSNALSCSSAT